MSNDELASATELNPFFSRFETTGSKERCREVLESVTVGSEDRVIITVANIFSQLSESVQDNLDPFQFAYRQQRSTEDAVATLMHLVSKHLDALKIKPYARVPFIDFSSAFNTIQPDILLSKMIHMGMNPHLIHWYCSFLTNRQQLVRVNNTYSLTVTTSCGIPQGCVSSPLLFTLYTSDCVTSVPNHHIIKCSADTALVALMKEGEGADLYLEMVDDMVKWCGHNGLILNTLKTEEIIFGTSHHYHTTPITIHNQTIKQSSSFKYLGVYVDSSLSWTQHVDYICNKVQQRIYFLRRLRSFGDSSKVLSLFFKATIQSVLQYGGSVWSGALSAQLRARILRLLEIYSKLVGHSVESIFFLKQTTGTQSGTQAG